MFLPERNLEFRAVRWVAIPQERITMVRMSADALKVLGSDFLQGIRTSDMYSPLRAVVDEGWEMEGDAALLVGFRESYFGERSRFSTTGGYETAVNGRGIPDLDIAELGEECIHRLMRRGTSFAWEALYAANMLLPGISLISRISAAPILMDPDYFTGYVTFCSSRFSDDAGIGVAIGQSGIQILISSEDCIKPLPN